MRSEKTKSATCGAIQVAEIYFPTAFLHLKWQRRDLSEVLTQFFVDSLFPL